MKEKEFHICQKRNNAGYREKKSQGKKRAIIAAVLSGLIFAESGAASTPDQPKMGIAVYKPQIYSVQIFKDTLKEYFKTYLNMDMEYDKKVKIKTKDSEIEFTADLYNKKAKVACEWTYYNPSDPYKENNLYLNTNESAMISNYMAGGEYILAIHTTDKKMILMEFLQFVKVYRDDHPVQK